jgi:hypothetical protein
LLQQVDVGFRVVRRRIDAPMPEDQAYLLEGDAIAQHLSCRRMAQGMGAFDWRNHAGPPHGALCDQRHAATIEEWPEWSDVSKEDAITLSNGRPAFHIGDDRVSNLLRERETNLIAGFPADQQRTGFPLDISEAELRHVAGSKSETCQQQEDRAIAATPR